MPGHSTIVGMLLIPFASLVPSVKLSTDIPAANVGKMIGLLYLRPYVQMTT